MFNDKEVDKVISKYKRTKKQQDAFKKRVSDRQKVFKRQAENQPINMVSKN
jgi:hypothetical protein